jgi:hypothetical protein
VHEAMKASRLKGNERLKAKVTLEIGGIGLKHEIDGEIALD